jgi:hypothetical protein
MIDLVSIETLSVLVSILALIASSPFWLRLLIYYIYDPDVRVWLGLYEFEAPLITTDIKKEGDLRIYVLNETEKTVEFDLTVRVDAPLKPAEGFNDFVEECGGYDDDSDEVWYRTYEYTISGGRQRVLPLPFQFDTLEDDRVVSNFSMDISLRPSIRASELHLPRFFGNLKLNEINKSFSFQFSVGRGGKIGFQ